MAEEFEGPKLQPSSQARTTLDPHAIKRLSKLLNHPSSTNLDTLTLTESSTIYFSAVIDYVGLLSHTFTPGTSRLSVERAVAAPDFDDDGLFSNDSLMSTKRLVREASRRPSSFGGGSGISAGLGSVRKNRKNRFVPSISMGMGDCVIPWPPPKEIRPAQLLSKMPCGTKKRTGKDHFVCAIDRLYGHKYAHDDDENDSEEGQELKRAEEEKVVNGDLIVDGKEERKKFDNKMAMEEWESKIEKEDKEYLCEPKLQIAVSLYSVGDPISVFEKVKLFKQLLLAHNGGAKKLYAFLKGVVTWRKSFTLRQDSGSFELYRYKMTEGRCASGSWESDGYHQGRDPSSVILSTGMLEQIFKDTEAFYSVDTKDWYRKHGLPLRRSYLFHGPPGTGKTSTIRVLAGKFGLTCCFLQFTSSGFSNQILSDSFKQIPSNALLVIEDVDSLFYEEREATMKGQITFSGLLNALDGLMSADGLITVLTTNHVKKLDSALVRGGRIDRSFLFDTPGKDEVKRYFKSFYPVAPDQLADEFVNVVWERREISRARNLSTLQQLFIASRLDTAKECVSSADSFFDSFFSMNVGNHERAQYHT